MTYTPNTYSDYKDSVVATTTGNVTLSGLATQGGGDWSGALTAGNRVLVKDQTVGSQNGIYAASAGGWTRTRDADQNLELTSGMMVTVEEGTTLADTTWIITNDGAITIGSTALTFAQISGSGGSGSSGAGIQGPNEYFTSTLSNGAIGFWRLGESSGLPQDSSGNGHHVTTVSGNPTYGHTGPLSNDSTTCMDFDHVGDALTVPYSAALNTAQLTIEAWIKVEGSAGVGRPIFVTRSATSISGAYMQISAGNSFDTILYDAGGIAARVVNVASPVTSLWYYMAMAYDGTTLTQYINGVPTGTSVDTYVPNTTADLYIGKESTGTSFFDGKIANVAYYNTALSAATISNRYIEGTRDSSGVGQLNINRRSWFGV